MKNKNANTRQNPTQNMRYATKCMTQSAFQKKILSLVQRAGDKVAEAMNLVDEAGAIAGINVHFERSKLAERTKMAVRNEQGDHINKSYEADDIDGIDDIDYSDEIKEVTLPELADMVSERTCFKPECTLCVLNTAFDVMDEQNLMLDLGTISADTSEEEDTADTEDDETYAECGCRDCDNCVHYDDCYGKSDGEYDESGSDNGDYGDDGYDCENNDGIESEDFNDSYDCGDDDEITSQPTSNTCNSRNTTRRDRQW